jgi:hypothetical protein
MHLTSIDPLIADSMEPSLIGNAERLAANLTPYQKRHTFIRDYSWNVLPTWNTLLDFLFIDGDHRYESVLRDYREWAWWLKPGGILAMHDSRMSRPGGACFHPGPSAVADGEVYGRPDVWEIIGEAFSLTMARRR